MNRFRLLFMMVVPLLMRAGTLSAQTNESSFFVSPNGSDENPGTQEKPFATLEHARDAIRALKQAGPLPPGGITVWLREGAYRFTKSFTLDTLDSGTKDAPIVYRGCTNEVVYFSGGREIGNFTRVDDPVVLRRIPENARAKVLQTDLKAQGITDFGELKAACFRRPIKPVALELFFQDKPMTLARWPNHDWAKIASAPAGPKGGMFGYEGDRPRRWTEADNIWLHGYWTYDWADSYEKVESIDLSNRVIKTYPPHGAYGYTPGKRYYVLNLLEELDEPGEWYVNRKTGILYFWPPSPINKGKAIVSLLETPMVVLQDTSNITLRDITFEFTRGSAIQIVGGTNNLVGACTFRNMGDVAVCIGSELENVPEELDHNPLLNGNGGVSNGIVGCDIYDTGEGGIILGGGDRVTLTPACNFAVNNHLHHWSRIVWAYRPAVFLYGVGNHAAHNKIHGSPHEAIEIHGNDHVVELNEIHDVCTDTSDAGALYMGRDFLERGNLIRHNFLHDIPSLPMVSAVYLDDGASGTMIFGNVFYKVPNGVLVAGGRDNVIANNIFDQCVQWACQLHLRGYIQVMIDRLKAINYKQPPYSERYPESASLANGDPFLPVGNQFVRNICWHGQFLNIWNVPSNVTVKVENNLTDKDPGFPETGKSKFQLKAGAVAFKLGFEPIPVEQIGLYRDKYRSALPALK